MLHEIADTLLQDEKNVKPNWAVKSRRRGRSPNCNIVSWTTPRVV